MQLKVCVHLCVCAIFLTILWTFSSFQLYYMDLILCIYCVWFFFFFISFVILFHFILFINIFRFFFSLPFALVLFVCQARADVLQNAWHTMKTKSNANKKKRRNEKRKSAVKQHKSIGLWLLFKVLENDRQSSFCFSTQSLALNWKKNPANELTEETTPTRVKENKLTKKVSIKFFNKFGALHLLWRWYCFCINKWLSLSHWSRVLMQTNNETKDSMW